MKLIVGLRNPGSDYEGTRHNVGFEVLTRVLERKSEKLGRAPLKVNGQVAKTGRGDDRVFYFASNRYMNDSGASVRAAALYYKITAEEILVIHDDIDLPFGRLRLQVAGGSGGHNGIRSVEKALGTKEFSRLKFGVGRPPGSVDPAEFVLKPFTKSERGEVELMIETAADVVELWPEEPARAQEMASLFGSEA
ncbi:MAG: aminoacyl-tRNA hydrolase [Actinobacteria bacterium]|nr:MAG: aminoacyl-tRNA hydrolase [Actinomycetota bacterium]REK41104.1 MAG: aminoacyl-tRNA hydrolase [Actinomycetota bacterium]